MEDPAGRNSICVPYAACYARTAPRSVFDRYTIGYAIKKQKLSAVRRRITRNLIEAAPIKIGTNVLSIRSATMVKADTCVT